MTWKCKQCGLCCTMFTVHVDNELDEDTINFFNYHKNMYALGPHTLGFKGKCKHLGFKNGKHYCKIYADRPEWCKKFNEKDCKSMHKWKEEIDKIDRIRKK